MKLKEIYEGVVVQFEPTKLKAKKELDSLLKTKIYGVYTKDADLWDKLEKFITNEKNPMEYRIEALKKLDQIHGEVQKSYSEKDVKKYMKELESDIVKLQQ